MARQAVRATVVVTVYDREIVEVTTEAQMVLSCLKRMGENYGKQMLMKVLAGSKEQKLQALGFDIYLPMD